MHIGICKMLSNEVLWTFSPSLTDNNDDLHMFSIHALAIGVLFATFVRTTILLIKFANYIRHLKSPWSFMTDFQIWVEVPMLILSVIFVSVFGRTCLCPSKEQWEIGIFAVLLVWLDFIIFIRYLQLHVFDIGNASNFRAAAVFHTESLFFIIRPVY